MFLSAITKATSKSVGATLAWLLIVTSLAFAQEVATDQATDLESLLEGEQQTVVEKFQEKYPEIRDAAQKFSQRDFKGAEETLRSATEAHGELPPAGVMLGKWYAQINNSLAARTAYELAVRDDEDDPEAYVVFGENALRQRRFTDAALLFAKGVDTAVSYNKNPERKRLLQLRAYAGVSAVAAARERWEDAEKPLRRALEIDKDNLALMARLGRVVFKQGQRDEAYKLFQKIYNQAPDKTARAELNMANLYQEEGKEDNALKLVNLAIQRDANNLNTNLAAAQWALTTGNQDLLEKCAAAAQSIDASSLQTQVLVGFMARLREDYTAAENAFQKALDAAPTSALALNQMAISLIEQPEAEKQRKAADYANMCNRLHGDKNSVAGREARITLAWVLFKNKRYAEAAQQVQLALSNGGVGPEAAFFAAVILKQRGQMEAAKTILERMLNDNKRIFPNRKKAEQLLAELRVEPTAP